MNTTIAHLDMQVVAQLDHLTTVAVETAKVLKVILEATTQAEHQQVAAEVLEPLTDRSFRVPAVHVFATKMIIKVRGHIAHQVLAQAVEQN